MRVEDLRQFLIDAAQNGYGSGDEGSWKKEDDESTTISYESGDFRMHDNFFGGEPYSGHQVVFHESHPAWSMVYRGTIDPAWKDLDGVYKFLRNAIVQSPEEAPFRGPAVYDDAPYHYRNFWQGDLEEFHGHEVISHDDEEIYRASYLGGLIDQRKEGQE